MAVWLTPEMLPAFVSVSLPRGAMAMSRKKVIVPQLDAMQNSGAMDVLCTDKTGTLTMDQVLVERHCDLAGVESERVLQHAFLISHFQTGLHNVLDEAIIAHRGTHPTLVPDEWRKLDEIPFDFSRRVMSVVVEGPDGTRRLISRRSPEEVFTRCTHAERDGGIHVIEPARLEVVRAQYDSLSNEGFRVLAVAARDVLAREEYSQADVRELTLLGYVGFIDPPRESAAPAIAALQQAGVTVKILANNLLYDFSQVAIPTDHVDSEQVAAPRPWAIGEITRFVLLIGPISSLFDYTTVALMWFYFGARTPAQAALFQTGWLVESLMTQTLIIGGVHDADVGGKAIFHRRRWI